MLACVVQDCGSHVAMQLGAQSAKSEQVDMNDLELCPPSPLSVDINDIDLFSLRPPSVIDLLASAMRGPVSWSTIQVRRQLQSSCKHGTGLCGNLALAISLNMGPGISCLQVLWVRSGVSTASFVLGPEPVGPAATFASIFGGGRPGATKVASAENMMPIAGTSLRLRVARQL